MTHALVPSVSSPGRPVIRAARRHAPAASVIRLSLSIATAVFQSTPRQPSSIRYSSSSRHSSRPISSRRASRSYLYRLVHTCRIRYTVPSDLARRVLFATVSSPGVAHDIAIALSTSPHPYHPIYPSYSRILVSLYLLYTSHTSYSLYTSIDETR